jgi:DNA topoisomerase IB
VIQLVHVSDATPGIARRRCGRGFAYQDPKRRPVPARRHLERIRALAIPPAWTDVWICTDPRGHLQATGRDARGRKQYRYHPEWRRARDADKFRNLVAFGERLPAFRRALRRDLGRPGLPREKVLAVAVSLLSRAEIRVGNEEYARSNGSYGLTTLRDRHLNFLRAGRATFRFRGKGGQTHEIDVDDQRLVRILRRCRQIPGQMLFQYIDDDGRHHAIDSTDVNEYLREAMGESFTAKDFRTWTATLLVAARLAGTPRSEAGDERAMDSVLLRTVDEVAAHLHNTRSVCRNSYIDPCVAEAWRHGRLPRHVPAGIAGQPRRLEAALVRLLRAERGRRLNDT